MKRPVTLSTAGLTIIVTVGTIFVLTGNSGKSEGGLILGIWCLLTVIAFYSGRSGRFGERQMRMYAKTITGGKMSKKEIDKDILLANWLMLLCVVITGFGTFIGLMRSPII